MPRNLRRVGSEMQEKPGGLSLLQSGKISRAFDLALCDFTIHYVTSRFLLSHLGGTLAANKLDITCSQINILRQISFADYKLQL